MTEFEFPLPLASYRAMRQAISDRSVTMRRLIRLGYGDQEMHQDELVALNNARMWVDSRIRH